jgi:hypothetical protein
MAAGIFDQIIYVDSTKATLLFVIIVVALILLEEVLFWLQRKANVNGYGELVEKLLKEMTIMGILTFATFLAQEGATLETEWYHAFHFAHILLLFIAIMFVAQALGLVILVNHEKRSLLKYAAHSAWDLVDE